LKRKSLPQAIIAGSSPSFNENITEPSIRFISTMKGLQSMKIPYDGDPPPIANSSELSEEWEWDDPYPAFEPVPLSTHPIASAAVKVIVFDLFGTVLASVMAHLTFP
jgi:hypothetical protein